MGCLTANITRLSSAIIPTITRLSSAIIPTITRLSSAIIPTITVSEMHSLSATTSMRSEQLTANVGIVCSIPEELIIRFAEKNLIWEGETNKEGVILYNTLIATGDWKLEEVTIEELL